MSPIKTELGRLFLAHWHSLRGEAVMPTLKQFLAQPDPVIQPRTLIVDVIEPHQLKVRLFAEGLSDSAAMDLTGRDLLSFAANAQMADDLWSSVSNVARHPCGHCSRQRTSSSSGRHSIIETVTLPLAPFVGGPPCAVSVVAVLERADHADTPFALLGYLDRAWLDIGAGVPAEQLTKVGNGSSGIVAA